VEFAVVAVAGFGIFLLYEIFKGDDLSSNFQNEQPPPPPPGLRPLTPMTHGKGWGLEPYQPGKGGPSTPLQPGQGAPPFQVR